MNIKKMKTLALPFQKLSYFLTFYCFEYLYIAFDFPV